MGYELHIQRQDEISLEEWKHAVEGVEGIRLEDTPLIMKNPKTGQILQMKGSCSDVAVRFVEKKYFGLKVSESWVKSIAFRNGRGVTRYTESLEDELNPVRKAISALSKKLEAAVVGDEGEVYHW